MKKIKAYRVREEVERNFSPGCSFICSQLWKLLMNLARCCVYPHTKPAATVSGPHSHNWRPCSNSQFITFSLRFYEACRITLQDVISATSGARSVSEVFFYFFLMCCLVVFLLQRGRDEVRMQRFGSLRGRAHMAAIGGIFKAQCGVSDEKHQTEEVFAPAILLEENKTLTLADAAWRGEVILSWSPWRVTCE